MEHEELYDQICRVLTWYEHPEECPLKDEPIDDFLHEEMYNTLVRVQNEMFNQ